MVEIKIVQFRRGRHTQTPRHFILSIEGVEDKKKAQEYIGKEVVWTSKSNEKIKGKIAATHGNKGRVRAIFEKGLPGQALGTKLELIGRK
ncbi:MAG: 50S ribosomal protein L35ae [Candidatus Pacearchaeota archaeon]